MSIQAASQNLRVLIADDDPIQRSLIASKLVAFDATPVEAEDGGAAWRMLMDGSYDLAIVDINMPNLNGTTLIQCMRSHPRTRHMPILVITSSTDLVVIAEVFAAGASSFMTKPLVWSTFQHHVGFMLRLVADARSAQVAVEQAAAKDRAKETILGNLCRETKAAAAAMLAEIEQLRRPAGIGAGIVRPYERIERIERELEGLTRLADKAATVVGAICSKIQVADFREPAAAIVARAVNSVAERADRADVTIDTKTVDATIMLACDAEAVELALAELLRNAIDGSVAGQSVGVSARLFADGLLALEVSDNGCGIDPDCLAASLAPLRVEVAGYARQEQLGFGLPLAKAIIEAHRGTLEVRSMPGEGTTAILLLPPDRVVTSSVAA